MKKINVLFFLDQEVGLAQDLDIIAAERGPGVGQDLGLDLDLGLITKAEAIVGRGQGKRAIW